MSELYTAAKLAKALGVPPLEVTRLLDDEEIEPDKIKGPCKYYGEETMELLKRLLEEEAEE